MMECIVDGKAYSCVRNWDRSVVECAPMTVLR